MSTETNAIAAEFNEYAYSVSHDLGGPVRAMVELSKLLTAEEANTLSADGKEYLSLIIENGEKMRAMMAGLLAYSRLNTMAKPLAPVSLTNVWEECCRMLHGPITHASATLEAALLPSVMADHEQILQLFQLLVENALLYQSKNAAPHLILSAQKKDEVWQLSLSDNGIGIPVEYCDRVFQIFRRLHTDAEYPGVGLGLTLAKKIVERHGGKIWIVSELGTGTIVHFTLPAIRETSVAALHSR